jgi:hypothetical protein
MENPSRGVRGFFSDNEWRATMSYFEANLNILSENAGHMIEELRDTDLKYRFVIADVTAEYFVDADDRVYELKKELDSQLQLNPKKRELIFILGIYATDEINHIINAAHENSIIVILEPELCFLAHALERKKLDFFKRKNVILLALPEEKLPLAIERILNTGAVYLAGNVKFAPTFFYRRYNMESCKRILSIITTAVKHKVFSTGNDIQDSLQGFRQTMSNLKNLHKSKDVRLLKNAFRNVPAILVAAGPSLDKNIHDLKSAVGKAIIIAADTILNKLLNEGIVPDFVTSIERYQEIYDYFYKNKPIPPEVTLVAPPVVQPIVFEQFPGDYIMPYRWRVGEYMWLDHTITRLGSEAFISMGMSCAHLSFGLAVHLGASPIVFVGQDLAYGSDGGRSHSSGTIYDEVPLEKPEIIRIDGYYGEKVNSQKIWVEFKNWFEKEIVRNNVKAINCTEGGALIKHTEQMPLRDMIGKYCLKPVNVRGMLKQCPYYEIDEAEVRSNLHDQRKQIADILERLIECQRNLQKIKVHPRMSQKQLLKTLERMKKTDSVIQTLFSNPLLVHAVQSFTTFLYIQFNRLEQDLSYATVSKNLDYQRQFIYVTAQVTQMVIEILDDHLTTI